MFKIKTDKEYYLILKEKKELEARLDAATGVVQAGIFKAQIKRLDECIDEYHEETVVQRTKIFK